MSNRDVESVEMQCNLWEMEKEKSQLKYCQTPGLVLSLRVDFVLPLSQEEEQQQQHPSPKFIILPIHAKLLKEFFLDPKFSVT